MPTSQSKSSTGKASILLWAILCIVSFIYLPGSVSILYGSTLETWQLLFPKLARIDLLIYIFDLLKAIMGMAVFSLAGITLGYVPLNFVFKIQKQASIPAQLAYISTAFLVGQGVLSVIFIVLGLNTQLTMNNVIFALTISLLVGIWPLYRYISTQVHPRKPSSTQPSKKDRYNTSLMWLLGSILLLSLLYSTARLSYDSVGMYFSDAKITALTHRINYFPNDAFVVSSFHTEIQYAAIMQVFGDQSARLYSWINGLAILTFVLALCDRFDFSRRARLIVLTLVLTSTAFLDLMGDGKIDLACSVWAIAAVYWMVINKATSSKNVLLLIGFLAGFAMIARPNNIFLLAIFIIVFYLQHAYHNRIDYKNWVYALIIKPMFFIGLGLSFWLGFHLAVNFYILGDPLAFLHNYQKVSFSGWQWAVDRNQIWLVRLLYPLTITFLNTPQSLGNISPLVIATLPGIFIADLRRKLQISKELFVIIFAALITLFLWVISFFTVFEIRYALFLWLLLFLPAALIVEKLMETYDPVFKMIIKTLLLATLAFIAVRTLYVSLDTYSPTDNTGNPHCFDNIFCKYLTAINDVASPGDRVLTLNAYRFYLRTDLFACSTTHEEYSQIGQLSHENNEKFWAAIYQMGYKYIAYEENYSKRHLYLKLLPDPANAPDWLTLKPISGEPGDPVVAYQIIVNSPPPGPQKSCIKDQSGIWQIKQLAP